MIKGGKEVDISKLSSEEFNINNLKVNDTSVLLEKLVLVHHMLIIRYLFLV